MQNEKLISQVKERIEDLEHKIKNQTYHPRDGRRQLLYSSLETNKKLLMILLGNGAKS